MDPVNFHMPDYAAIMNLPDRHCLYTGLDESLPTKAASFCGCAYWKLLIEFQPGPSVIYTISNSHAINNMPVKTFRCGNVWKNLVGFLRYKDCNP